MENKNIFEGAKFGDKFITRDGTLAIFEFLDSNGEYQLRQFDYERSFPFTFRCWEDGLLSHNYICGRDIVSRYKETIDEEKLDELATEYALEELGEEHYPEFGQIKRDFKTGYRKAKEK